MLLERTAVASLRASAIDEDEVRRDLNEAVMTFLCSRRAQLLLVLVLGVFIPSVAAWPSAEIDRFLRNPALDNNGFNTMVGAAFAGLFGLVTFRQLRTHPGAETYTYVISAFTMSFGFLGLAYLFTRIEYARYQLIATYVATTIAFLVLQVMTRRHRILRLAVVPNAGNRSLPDHRSIIWIPLGEPSLGTSKVSGVVADLRADHGPEWERFLAHCALSGLPVFHLKQAVESITGRVDIEILSENTLASTLHGLVYARAKRALDLTLAVMVLPFFALLILAAAIAIRLEAPGPVFFRQVRMGHRGRPFVMWKLRSMRSDAGGAHFTTANDDRITRVGAVIRKYRIDELPQLWNIIRGDMSWIGPRPEAAELSDWYEREVPFYSWRHIVRPGLTGWAAVNQGNVAEVDAAREKLQYDFYYIKYFSPWLDLLVVMKTIRTILTGFGSR